MSESENNQNQQNGEGGLFSDEYETPKRENPYLKKKREKASAEASHAESAPKPEKTKREKKPKAMPAASVADTPVAPTEAAQSEEQGYVRKRTFSDWMFEHVKLIAAIATILVVLSLVLITDVVDIVQNFVFQSQQAEKEELTLTYVKGLSEKGAITWSDLEKFRRDESKANGSLTWMIPVKGSAYEVWISGVSTSKRPTYVYLFDLKTGDRMVLGEDDFDAFIESHSK